MSHLKGLTGFAAVAAACTAMTWGTIASAATPDQDSMPTASNLTLEQPIAPAQAAAAQNAPQFLDDATPPTPWTLQGAIDKTAPGQFLDKYKLTLNMFVEGSYLYSLRKVPNYTVPDRVFDVDDQHLDLNQADVQLARAVTQGTTWDWGGLIEVQYGRDARFIHSNGLDFYHPSDPFSPPDQFDLTQAYLTLNVPVGTGLVVTAGKFVTLLGYETINPTLNALYSHSFSFGFAIPFTNTGLTAEYQLNNQWTATLGFTRGWDQAFKDNNGDAPDVIGQLAYTSYDVKGLKGYFNFISGPESADIVPDHVNRYWRTVVEGILSYAWGDNWTFATDAVFGYEPKAGSAGQDANWFGDAVYATYKFNSYLSATGRGEYFSDHDGARGIGAEVYEATAGLEVTPFPTNEYLANLLFRPEFREDWSGEDAFAGKHNQATIAADVIYKF
jgi:hypothetical protein